AAMPPAPITRSWNGARAAPTPPPNCCSISPPWPRATASSRSATWRSAPTTAWPPMPPIPSAAGNMS
ncbi:hypothetical protein LTR94_038407, partial [Friedmanniomyces endolithicus]